jgi:thioredoxin-like negative regulator of GroEL
VVGPIFKELAHSLNGCSFALVAMNSNRRLMEMSMQTHKSTQITAVPAVYLYLNGTPLVRYSGTYTLEDLKKFVLDTYNAIQQQITFTNQSYPTEQHPNVQYNPKLRGIAQWSIGKALFGDDDENSYLHIAEDPNNLQTGRR